MNGVDRMPDSIARYTVLYDPEQHCEVIYVTNKDHNVVGENGTQGRSTYGRVSKEILKNLRRFHKVVDLRGVKE